MATEITDGLEEILRYYAAGTEVTIKIQANRNGEWQEQELTAVLGPPLFPGLMAALVWSRLLVIAPPLSSSTVTSRFRALMMPLVTDCP